MAKQLQAEEVRSAKSPLDEKEQRAEDQRRFMKLAMERFQLCSEAESSTRKASLDDFEFRAGKQWPADILAQRATDGRPCLTMDRLANFTRQVTNEQRQQRPSIQVNPVGDGSDQETAEIEQGICRHIEVQSDAEIAYDNAFEHMCIGGFGYWRNLIDYVPRTFDLEIYIKRIKNPFTVYMDPSAIEPDYSDAKFAFVIEDLTREEYKRQFPNTDLASLVDLNSTGDAPPGWVSKDSVRIAEYWHVEEEERTLLLMEDGQVVDERDIDPDTEWRRVKNERQEFKRKVIFSKINAVEEIETTEWPGQWIPIVRVDGDDIDINGKRYNAGLIRNMKDPQRARNYWVSAATETIALAPKAPWVAAEGQLEGHEPEWKQSNVRNLAVLTYKQTEAGGKPAPPPQRQAVEPPIQAISQMIALSDNDLKAAPGLYDASLGAPGPEQSGKAILARQKQGDVATLNFSDNLARSIRHQGRILLDLIPKVYTAEKVQRIIKPDGAVDHVGIYNSQNGQQDPEALKLKLGMRKVYDIGVGRYDVTVSVGPSFQSKRQEAVAAMMALVQAYPQMVQVAGDLMVRSMDWPGAQEIADRLKKMVPPQLLDDSDETPEVKLQKVQGQLQALTQQHDALTQALNQANQIINTKQVEQQAKVVIAKLQSATQIAVAEIGAKTQNAQVRAQLEADELSQMHDAAHEIALQKDQQAHEADQSQQAQAAQAQQAQQSESAQGAAQ